MDSHCIIKKDYRYIIKLSALIAFISINAIAFVIGNSNTIFKKNAAVLPSANAVKISVAKDLLPIENIKTEAAPEIKEINSIQIELASSAPSNINSSVTEVKNQLSSEVKITTPIETIVVVGNKLAKIIPSPKIENKIKKEKQILLVKDSAKSNYPPPLSVQPKLEEKNAESIQIIVEKNELKEQLTSEKSPESAHQQNILLKSSALTAKKNNKTEAIAGTVIGIAKINKNNVLLKNGGIIKLGERFPSGERLLSIDPENDEIITDKRTVLIF